MRKILIQSNTSDNKKRKNLCITEIVRRNGYSAKAEKKYSYFVSQQSPFLDSEKLKSWVDLQSKNVQKKDRHVCIQKTYDKKTGTGQMIYRVIGSFYVVQNLQVFAVVFMHSIKFDMLYGDAPQASFLIQPE